MADPPSSDDPVAHVAVGPLVAVAVVLLVATIVFMASPDLNVAVFTATQRWTTALPDTAWSMVTVCGTGVVAFALLSTTLPWQPRWYAAAVASAALAGAYSNGFKHLYGLPRPPSVLDADHLHVIGHTLHANTFPSGHSVTAFTLASLLIFASRRPVATMAWTLPAAAVIAVSRIAVGAHWPADIAAGALGGWASGAIGVAIVARWRRWNHETGIRLLAVVSLGIGISLFAVDLGYPLAVPLQDAAGLVAMITGLVALARPRLDPAWPDRTR